MLLSASTLALLRETFASNWIPLRILNIHKFALDSIAISELSKAIASARHLAELSFSLKVNEQTLCDLAPLATIFRDTRSIIKLDLSFGFSLQQTGFEELCDAIASNRTIITLKLHEYNESNISRETIIALKLEKKPSFVVQALKTNKVLRDVDINLICPCQPYSKKSEEIWNEINSIPTAQYDCIQWAMPNADPDTSDYDDDEYYNSLPFRYTRPTIERDRIRIQASRLFKLCRIFARYRIGKEKRKVPVEIFQQIFRHIAFDKKWNECHYRVIVQCLLDVGTIGKVCGDIDQVHIEFNESSLFSLCNRAFFDV